MAGAVMPVMLAVPGAVAAGAGVTLGSGCSEQPVFGDPLNDHLVDAHAEGAPPPLVMSALMVAVTLEDGLTVTGPADPLTVSVMFAIEAKAELLARVIPMIAAKVENRFIPDYSVGFENINGKSCKKVMLLPLLSGGGAFSSEESGYFCLF